MAGVSRFRGLQDLIDDLVPASSLPQTLQLTKLRTDFTEFCVYTPVTTDGVEWVRWLFSNRFNVGAVGSAGMRLASVARLYASLVSAAHSENQASGTEAQAPSTTKASAAADSRVGAWTGPATVDGVTDIIYSTTIGDIVTYTLVGVNRIALRSYNNPVNGGIIQIVVKQAGVEITSGYTIPDAGAGLRTVNLKVGDQGLQYITVADGLATNTYTIEISVHSSNPGGGRSYEGGVRGYLTVAYNAAGRQGIFSDISSGGNTYKTAYFSGAKSIYQLTNATKIAWRHNKLSNSGKMEVRVYDSVGVEISALSYDVVANEIDTYSTASSALYTTPIASGLVKGTYYLHVTIKDTKNASSSGYRQYDFGAVAYDETTAGVVGTDAFDDLGVPRVISSFVTDITDGTMFIGTGALECAIKVRRATDAQGVEDFVGNIHGNETNPASVVVTADGATINYSGAAQFADFTAGEFSITFTTSMEFLTGSDTWANMSYTYTFSPSGYVSQTTRTVTAEAVVYDDYSLMLPVPNSTNIGFLASKGAGGPYQKLAIDGDFNYATTANDDSLIGVDLECRGAVAWNSSYAVYGMSGNMEAVRAIYSPSDSDLTTDLTLYQDRSDGSVKFYSRAFRYAPTGTTLTSPDSYTHINAYRVVKATGLDALLTDATADTDTVWTPA